MKLLRTTLMACCAVVCAAQLSHAQSANIYAGVATATDDSNGQQIDPFGTGTTTMSPKLTGAFVNIGASVLFTPHLGVGFDASWRASRGDYAGVQYRPSFYSFDGIYTPVKSKRFEPELRAGIGGMKLAYSFNQQSCNPLSGCSSSREDLTSSSHFQFDMGAAARFYVTDHVFVRPAIDVHYVPNLFQFASNWVPQYSVGVGYSFGKE